MKAFVLAGGLGTRLKPRFGDVPKPLVPVAGRPFVVRQIEWLRARGVREVVLCTGHGAASLRESVEAARVPDVTVHYSEEPEPLGTGGALRLAAHRVDGPALVLNGDSMIDVDPWALERARWEHAAVGAIALYQAEDPAARGRVESDAEDRIVRFVEKDPDARGTAWVNGGLYAFGPELWRRLPQGVSSLERDVLPALAAAGALRALRAHGAFVDIGTPEAWERAERHFAT